MGEIYDYLFKLEKRMGMAEFVSNLPSNKLFKTKCQEYIDKMIELQGMPGDVKFLCDGKKMGIWFKGVKKHYAKALNKKCLDILDYEYIYIYGKIMELKEEYEIKDYENKLESRLSECLEYLRENGEFPVDSSAVFSADGSSMMHCLNRFKLDCKKLHVKKAKRVDELSVREKISLKYYEKMKPFFDLYPSKSKSYLGKRSINELCISCGVNMDENKDVLNKPYSEVYVKVMYLKNKKLDVSENVKIFYMSDILMQQVYGISLDELIDLYIFNNKKINKLLK